MYCNKCLGTIHEGEKFCTHCGAPIEIKVTEGTINEEEIIKISTEVSSEKVDESMERISLKDENEDTGPIIHIDPKTGQSIMPENNKKEAEKPAQKPKFQPISNQDDKKPPINTRTSLNEASNTQKVVNKNSEFIIGIIAVVLSFMTSLFSAFIFIGFAGTNDSGTFLMTLLGLRGFVFATIGLIGVMNVKKNSTVAGLFLISAAVGSLFSLQLIRGGLFMTSAIMCFSRHEKTEKPLTKTMIVAFLPTIIVGILVLISLILVALADDTNIINGVNTVYIRLGEMV